MKEVNQRSGITNQVGLSHELRLFVKLRIVDGAVAGIIRNTPQVELQIAVPHPRHSRIFARYERIKYKFNDKR